MFKNRIISTFLIQGCFLAVIAVLTPFGFYSGSAQPPTEPARTELVEQLTYQLQTVPDFTDFRSSDETVEFVTLTSDHVKRLAIQAQQCCEALKQASTGHINSPVYYPKTTTSTSSEDEPLGDSHFA